jgi:hypothetical protein
MLEQYSLWKNPLIDRCRKAEKNKVKDLSENESSD